MQRRVQTSHLRAPCRALGLAALLLAAASPAHAQLAGDATRDEANRTKPYRAPSTIAAQARFGELGEDWFFTAIFQLNYNQDEWGIGLQLPLRVRLKDRDPQDEGVVRKEDWDQATDYLKLLRYFYVGQADKRGPYYFQGGDLMNLTIGHGTVMHRYFNNLDINRWRTGLNVASRIQGFSVEAVLGDLLRPYLTGTRVAVRPFEMYRGFEHAWYDRFEIGTTFMADWVAPLALARGPDGQMGEPGPVLVDEDTYEPLVADKRVFTAFGVDVGLPIALGGAVTLTPYTDINKLAVVDHGLGLHLGALLDVLVERGIDHPFEARFRAEFRHVSGDYLGPYFNTVYEIERFQRLASRGGAGQSKLQDLCGEECGASPPPSRNGLWLEASAGLRDVFYLGAEYLAYSGDQADGSFRLFVEVPYFDHFQAKAFYYRINTTGLDDVFGFDDRTALLTEIRVPFLYVLSANARWIRVWQARPDGGGFESVDDWNFGLGVYVRL